MNIYTEALLHVWLEAQKNCSIDVLVKVVQAILTILFGLCAGGVNSQKTITWSVQR